MHTSHALAALSALVLAHAQSPVEPTPSSAVIIDGGPSFDGPVIPGVTGKLGDAQVVQGNPVGAVYKATFPDSKTSGVRGYVTASAGPGGEGLDFKVYLYGLPSESEGPFLYHIHELPVPADGDCAATKAHLDPYLRGEVPPCDNTHPATCQVGDLTGKHGNVTTSPFSAAYLDPYVSDSPGNKASLVGKSVVVHTSNTTRLTCANFELVSSSGSGSASGTAPSSPSGTGSSGSGTGTSNASTPTKPSVVPFSTANAAVENVAGYGAVVVAGGLAVAAFFL